MDTHCAMPNSRSMSTASTTLSTANTTLSTASTTLSTASTTLSTANKTLSTANRTLDEEAKIRVFTEMTLTKTTPHSPYRRLRIIHIITGLNAGGAEHALEQLIAHTDRTQYDVSVVSLLNLGTVGPRLIDQGIPVLVLGMQRKPSDCLKLWRLIRHLRREKPDIVQTWLYHADLLGLIAAKASGVRHVFWNVRGSRLDHRAYRNRFCWIEWLLALLSRWPDQVITNAHAARLSHGAAGYRPKRWHLIQNAIDATRFHPTPGARETLCRCFSLPADHPIIAHVARLDPMKDHKTFLLAAQRLVHQGIAAEFFMIGRDVQSDNGLMQEFLADPLLAPHLHFLGERQDIHSLMPGFDIFTLTSAFGEGFPNVLAEAMACGVAVVATDVGDAALIVGETGHLVAPRDPDAIVAAWRHLIENPARRHEIATAGRMKIQAQFNPEQMAAAYHDLYQTCCTPPQSRAKN